MWTAEFKDGIPLQPTSPGDPLDRVLRLVHQRLRLQAARLIGGSVVVGQLSKAARLAQVHSQRMHLVGVYRSRYKREVFGRRHFAEVQDPDQSGFPAPP